MSKTEEASVKHCSQGFNHFNKTLKRKSVWMQLSEIPGHIPQRHKKLSLNFIYCLVIIKVSKITFQMVKITDFLC